MKISFSQGFGLGHTLFTKISLLLKDLQPFVINLKPSILPDNLFIGGLLAKVGTRVGTCNSPKEANFILLTIIYLYYRIGAIKASVDPENGFTLVLILNNFAFVAAFLNI